MLQSLLHLELILLVVLMDELSLFPVMLGEVDVPVDSKLSVILSFTSGHI